MNPSSWAGVITAIATVVTALALLVSALGVMIPTLRRTKLVEQKVDQVHVMVNQERTDRMAYQEKLIAALQAGSVTIPTDDSLKSKDTRNGR